MRLVSASAYSAPPASPASVETAHRHRSAAASRCCCCCQRRGGGSRSLPRERRKKKEKRKNLRGLLVQTFHSFFLLLFS